MKIAFDISPIKANEMQGHKVRGAGFYIKNLKESLVKYFPKNSYTFFTRGELLPKDVDVVHYPYFEPFFLTLAKNKNLKTVVTVHDLTPLVFPNHFPIGIKGKIKWLMQKYALRKSDAIITDSQCSKLDIIKYTGITESKITVIYLSAGEEFKVIKNEQSKISNIRKKYKLPEKFVLYVGDVTWNKNLPRLVEAVKKTNIPLVMVGKMLVEKNFDRKNLWNRDLKIVQENIKNNNQFFPLGFVSQEELVSLYNMAKVFVMPSLYEGFGLPLLEAMKCGCSVVTTKEGSLPEIAQDAAYFVDAYSTESIANGIKQVFLDKNLQKNLFEKGLKQANKFSWKKVSQETVKVYEKVNQG